MSIVIDDDEKVKRYNSALNFYQNGSFHGRIIRLKKYNEDNDKFSDQQLTTIAIIYASTTVGCVTGALIGSCVAGPPGTVIGGGVGIGVGFVVGSMISTQMVRVEYIKWKREHRKDDFLKELLRFHKDSPELEDFICPLSLDIMEDPVISIYNRTYSRKFIVQWINDTKMSENNDPMRNGRLDIKDISTDYAMIGRMAKTYQKLINDDSKLIGLSKEAQKGMKALCIDMQREVNNSFEHANLQAQKKYNMGILTRVQYAQLILKIAQDLE